MSLPASDGELLLLHNPRCSKSRAALALLEERKASFAVRMYLEDPLSRDELDELRRRLDRPAREWCRKGEDAFREAGLGGDAGNAGNAGDGELLDLMVQHPIVIERPILVGRDRAVVGRPPEDVLDLL
ncbi:MAG: arsenate reductase (glutaredoxin) [Proteobacteria bacterium]|nr:arsenate reductase (glutaredoxin) [Pseudomonadota bacterium]